MLPLASVVFAGATTKADAQTAAWRYEIQPVAEGKQGTYKVKVWSFSKKKEVAQEQSKKNAVHGILFKGYAPAGRIHGQNPIVSDPSVQAEHADFFRSFFATGGDYMRFVSLTSNVPEYIKVGKEYKVGLIVTVQKDALRKYLEDNGIIRALNAGF